MAHFSAKSRLFNELSRSRTSSPNAEEFATAGSFDMNNDQIINSTVNMENSTAHQGLPLHYDQHPNPYEPSEPDSEGSADMSIELGRGAKRGVRDQDADVSSNLVLSIGNNSQIDVTATSSPRPRTASRKSDGVLRREASVKHAAGAAKSNMTSTKHRSLSETLAKLNAEDHQDSPQPTATFNTRNTRFTRPRQVPVQADTPRRMAASNQTVQSAVHTANSFMLPDLPNISELVSGVRKDGTPVFSRSTKPTRSRFTANSKKPARPEHAPIANLPVPDEEKAIWSSLQLLKDKVAALEQDKAEADKRAEEYECEIIDLRSQLQAARRRPDSALGSDEEGASDGSQLENTRLRASVKSLQDRLYRSERKISVSEITVKRVAKERDELVTQIGVAYFNNEELKAENEAFRANFTKQQAENEALKEQIEDLRTQLARTNIQHDQGPSLRRRTLEDNAVPDRRRDQTVGEIRGAKRRSAAVPAQEAQEDIASKIAREVQKHRKEASALKAQERGERDKTRHTSLGQSRSKSQHRQQSVHKRTASAPLEVDVNGDTSTAQRDLTQKTRDTIESMHLPSAAKPLSQEQREEDSRDLTLLSFLDPNEVAKLRKKLEDERRASKEERINSVSRPDSRQDETVRSVENHLMRKSSLRDAAVGFENGAPEMARKSVRVQSPQLTETGDISILSNTSRRRRRVSSTEGMTSAFILPDITLHGQEPLPTISGKTCIQHDAERCTVCRPKEGEFDIPTPVPVTDRQVSQDPDITTATLRPAQPPPLALATVIKQIEDEIKHLKLQLAEQQRRYQQHDPALSKRQRLLTKSRMESLQSEIEKRSDQVYALYDVLEGQKQAAAATAEKAGEMNEEEVEETLMSVGIDPAELSGRVGRNLSTRLDGVDDGSESEELPWEGLSDYESEE